MPEQKIDYDVKASDTNAEPESESVPEIISSKDKGDAFEDFVCDMLDNWQLKLIDRTQDRMSPAGVVAESSKNPDLHIQQKYNNGNIDYFLECKYRSKWTDDKIVIRESQLARYKQFQREHHRKVIIALGVGGSADNPQIFMLVPIDSIKNNTIRKIDSHFSVSPSTSDFCEYMSSYFSTVFKKSRSGK